MCLCPREGVCICVRVFVSVCVCEDVHVSVCVRVSMSVSVWGCPCLREGVHVDQRRVKGPLEMEIQAVVSPLTQMLGT